MIGGAWQRVACALVALALPACGVSRGVYEQERDDLRAQVAALRKQLEGQNSQLASQGNALAELRLRARDNAAAVGEVRREVEEVRRRFGSLEGGIEGVRKEVANLAARTAEPRERPAAPAARAPSPPAPGVERGRTARVIRQFQGRPLYFAGGFQQPGAAKYQLRLPPGTRVQLLGEQSRGFVRVRVLSGSDRGKVVWVRAKWLEPGG